MSIYEYDEERHIQQERKAAREKDIEKRKKENFMEGIRILAKTLKEFDIPKENAICWFMDKFSLSREEAEKQCEDIWTKSV